MIDRFERENSRRSLIEGLSQDEVGTLREWEAIAEEALHEEFSEDEIEKDSLVPGVSVKCRRCSVVVESREKLEYCFKCGKCTLCPSCWEIWGECGCA